VPVPLCVDPLKVKYPGLPEVNVGEPTNVMFCCDPAKSIQVVPLPGYEDEFPASSLNVRPLVTYVCIFMKETGNVNIY
jgi:hypothetical protein